MVVAFESTGVASGLKNNFFCRHSGVKKVGELCHSWSGIRCVVIYKRQCGRHSLLNWKPVQKFKNRVSMFIFWYITLKSSSRVQVGGIIDFIEFWKCVECFHRMSSKAEFLNYSCTINVFSYHWSNELIQCLDIIRFKKSMSSHQTRLQSAKQKASRQWNAAFQNLTSDLFLF